jgi:DNA-binding NarL/FixJ family response regulator
MSIQVIITDDHPLAIAGLQNMLLGLREVTVIATYSSAEALLEGLQNNQPDILLLDIMLPGKKGSEIAAIITNNYPNIKILVMTSLDAPNYIKNMMRSGCKGYLLKNADQEVLWQAIEALQRGEEFIQPQLKEQMLQQMLHFQKQKPEEAPPLTRREKEILELIVKEYSNQQIASQLYISLRTVENHRYNLQQKLEVNNSVALIKTAIQMGITGL